MAIYTLSDLHLAQSVDKPMDIFGDNWVDYHEKILENCTYLLTTDDTLVIPGDISWASNLEESLSDFLFLDKIRAKKIISKGNHDYWFSTKKATENFLNKNGIYNIQILHNNSFLVEDIYICGTKWYGSDGGDITQWRKMKNREQERLKISLESAKGDYEKVVFLHFPPCDDRSMFDILTHHGVKRVYYGHLHNEKEVNSITKHARGIDFCNVSSNILKFFPKKI